MTIAITSPAGIIQCGDELLFTIRANPPAQDHLDLPGGFVDFDESLEESLVREIKEELGIRVTDWQYLCSFPNAYPYQGVTYHTSDAVFFTQLEHKPYITLQKDEIESYKWQPFSKISSENLAFESLKRALEVYLDKKP